MDPSKILIWNVRGLNSVARQDSVRTLVESTRADIVCLQETKMENVSRRTVLSALGSSFSHYVFAPSVGASGGILTAWKHDLGPAISTRVDTYSSSVQFQPANKASWWLTCVYGPQGNNEKIQFLQELREIRSACTGPWVIAGDFNLIYKEDDRNNANLNRAMMGRFRRTLNDLALKELPLNGRNSPGVGEGHPQHLDRVFCTIDWENEFPNYLLQSTASMDSDHCPLLLGLSDLLPGKGRFHFESFWPQLEGFQEVVTEAWNSVEARYCPLETLSWKLKALTKALQSWSQKLHKIAGSCLIVSCGCCIL